MESMRNRPVTVMLISKEMQARCFLEQDLKRIEAVTQLRRAEFDACTDETQLTAIGGAEIAITGWDSRPITQPMLALAPALKLVCHSAGSVKSFIHTEVFLSRGIRVCSARSALPRAWPSSPLA